MIIRLFALICIVCASTESSAEENSSLDEILDRMAAKGSVSGEFRQLESVDWRTDPLESKGRFEVQPGESLVWSVESPVASQIIVEGENVLLNGKPVNARGAAYLASQLLKGLVSANRESLEERFDLSVESQGENWTLRLTPLDRRMKKAIRDIRLNGSETLEVIEIRRTDQGSITIRFHNVMVTGS